MKKAFFGCLGTFHDERRLSRRPRMRAKTMKMTRKMMILMMMMMMVKILKVMMLLKILLLTLVDVAYSCWEREFV